MRIAGGSRLRGKASGRQHGAGYPHQQGQGKNDALGHEQPPFGGSEPSIATAPPARPAAVEQSSCEPPDDVHALMEDANDLDDAVAAQSIDQHMSCANCAACDRQDTQPNGEILTRVAAQLVRSICKDGDRASDSVCVATRLTVPKPFRSPRNDIDEIARRPPSGEHAKALQARQPLRGFSARSATSVRCARSASVESNSRYLPSARSSRPTCTAPWNA